MRDFHSYDRFVPQSRQCLLDLAAPSMNVRFRGAARQRQTGVVWPLWAAFSAAPAKGLPCCRQHECLLRAQSVILQAEGSGSARLALPRLQRPGAPRACPTRFLMPDMRRRRGAQTAIQNLRQDLDPLKLVCAHHNKSHVEALMPTRCTAQRRPSGQRRQINFASSRQFYLGW